MPYSKAVSEAAYEKAMKAIEVVKLAVTTEGAKASKLNENLLSNEARQPWEKIIKG